MQKIILDKTGNNLTEINRYLSEGWTVKMISTSSAGAGENCYTQSYAYVLLEKDED